MKCQRRRSKRLSRNRSLQKTNLESCEVKAPFKGYIAVKYKQDFEPVERLEKIFAIVDTEKVYAVAIWPEKRLTICQER